MAQSPKQEVKIINGKAYPPVSPAPGCPGRRTNQLSFLEVRVLRSLERVKDSLPFRKPVDTVRLSLDDYHEVIKQPMDMETIKHRLQNNYYTSASECIRDFNTIFDNCFLYNNCGDPVYEQGKRLQHLFQSKLRIMPSTEHVIKKPVAAPGKFTWTAPKAAPSAKVTPGPSRTTPKAAESAPGSKLTALGKIPTIKKVNPEESLTAPKAPVPAQAEAVAVQDDDEDDEMETLRAAEDEPTEEPRVPDASEEKTSTDPSPRGIKRKVPDDETVSIKEQLSLFQGQLEQLQQQLQLLTGELVETRKSQQQQNAAKKARVEPMSYNEKRQVSLAVQRLSQQQLREVVAIVMANEGTLDEPFPDEVDFDFGVMKDSTLRALQCFLVSCLNKGEEGASQEGTEQPAGVTSAANQPVGGKNSPQTPTEICRSPVKQSAEQQRSSTLPKEPSMGMMKSPMKEPKEDSASNTPEEDSESDSASESSAESATRKATEGDSASESSEGDSANEAVEGDFTRKATRGDSTHKATEGDSTHKATEGDSSSNATEGDSASEAAEGDSDSECSEGESDRECSEGDSASESSEGDSDGEAAEESDTELHDRGINNSINEPMEASAYEANQTATNTPKALANELPRSAANETLEAHANETLEPSANEDTEVNYYEFSVGSRKESDPGSSARSSSSAHSSSSCDSGSGSDSD